MSEIKTYMNYLCTNARCYRILAARFASVAEKVSDQRHANAARVLRGICVKISLFFSKSAAATAFRLEKFRGIEVSLRGDTTVEMEQNFCSFYIYICYLADSKMFTKKEKEELHKEAKRKMKEQLDQWIGFLNQAHDAWCAHMELPPLNKP